MLLRYVVYTKGITNRRCIYHDKSVYVTDCVVLGCSLSKSIEEDCKLSKGLNGLKDLVGPIDSTGRGLIKDQAETPAASASAETE